MPYNAKLVRDRREQKGWNQTELAHRARVSVSVVSEFENHRRQTTTMAVRIAKALGMKVADLWISDEKAEAQRGIAAKRKAG